MDLSIIIAHYDPGNHPLCIESFHKTLNQIENQKDDYNIEVIIADDGSISNLDIELYGIPYQNKSERKYYHLKNNSLEKWKKKKKIDYSSIKHWLYLPKIKPQMSKAVIGNICVDIASSSNLFFLDDDNYFISNKTIRTILDLFEEFELIIGQIQDNNGRFRPYTSRKVQGTTFGIIKKHMIGAGLFGEWTEEVSSGVDSDLWWKLYHYFKKYPHLKACFTTEIQTFDSCSKRWKNHIKTIFRRQAVKKLFFEKYGCTNYRNVELNPSRKKSRWLINLK